MVQKKNEKKETPIEEINYEQSMAQLKEIVEKLENDELDIDHLVEQLTVARKLIEQCRKKLTYTEEEVKKIMDEK